MYALRPPIDTIPEIDTVGELPGALDGKDDIE